MKLDYQFTKGDLSEIKADLACVMCKKVDGEEEKKPGLLLPGDGGIDLDKKLDGAISAIIREQLFTGDTENYKVIQTHGQIAAKNVLVLGMGEEKDLDLDTIRKIAAMISGAANSLRAKSISGVIEPKKIKGLFPEDRMRALAEGFILGGYRFDKYKAKKDLEKDTFTKAIFTIKGGGAGVAAAVAMGETMATAINFARDLVNLPGSALTPADFAKEALKACGKGLTCKVLDEAQIKKEKMGLLCAVSAGSANPPKFIHIKYRPAKKAKTSVAIVGKGVTFDSGGYNLKPGRGMSNMKGDMGGAAAALAIMMLLPAFKPKVAVDAYIPASENMIDAKATKPGDVIVSRSGKTVEIDNTDAEGRLILADAIDYALGNKPDILIDLATLTGGVLYALGEIYTAILGNDQKLIDKIISASKVAGEPTWQLPLEKEYLTGFKKGIADLTNVGKSGASTINGGLFLGEFIGKTRWAHMDIAESSWLEEGSGYRKKGGTGAGIHTLVSFLMGLS